MSEYPISSANIAALQTLNAGGGVWFFYPSGALGTESIDWTPLRDIYIDQVVVYTPSTSKIEAGKHRYTYFNAYPSDTATGFNLVLQTLDDTSSMMDIAWKRYPVRVRYKANTRFSVTFSDDEVGGLVQRMVIYFSSFENEQVYQNPVAEKACCGIVNFLKGECHG